jgi:hypothetical protein
MLTKKGTTDMDRIASQIAKDAKGTVKKWMMCWFDSESKMEHEIFD